MTITATCRNCQRSFELTWLIEGPVVTGECPWCETELTPAYVPLLPGSVRRAERGLALLLAGLGDLHSLSRGWSRFRVDPASIAEPIEEKFRSDAVLGDGDGDGATHGGTPPPPMMHHAPRSKLEWLRPTESEDDVARRRERIAAPLTLEPARAAAALEHLRIAMQEAELAAVELGGASRTTSR
jgi:hypothetical protein